VRPLPEQTIMVTGATDGLGRHLAGELVRAGVTVLVHGRDRVRLDRVRDELAAGPGRVETLLADLADLHQVDRLADEVLKRFDRLDVLLNNAGVGFGEAGSVRELSADGVELRFAVNYLAGYHLTRRLLPLLEASAPARVVNVASAGQAPIDFDDPMIDHGYAGVLAYRRSKLAQVMFTFDLAEELRAARVTVNALHPATFMDTSMVRLSGREPVSTLEEGAAATYRLVTAPDLDEVTGRYFDRTREARADGQAYDREARARLRELTGEILGRVLPASA
jgi:NAD(P)-dependent dehydrogenase (short-subunit alcohol dehydrogenase family)